MITNPNFSRREERGKAEATAIDHIKQKHKGSAQIFLRTVYHEENVWVIMGKVAFKRAYFFEAEKSFIVKLNPKTKTVESYVENALLPPKER